MSKRYGSRSAAAALEGVSLQIPAGAYLVMLGPSGCGKSTLLRCVAGVEDYDGEILIDGIERQRLSSSDLRCEWLPQRASETFIAHRSLAQNIALAAALRGEAAPVRQIEDVAQRLRIYSLLGRRPREVSGGELQRAALCRTLLGGSGLVLLDEPLTGIDEQHRNGIRRILAEGHQATRSTVIHVSHDAGDAFALADFCAVINEGRLQQFGAVGELLHDPANEFVLEFLGAPELNRVDPSLLPPTLSSRTPSGARVLIRAKDVLATPAETAIPGGMVYLASGYVKDQRWFGDRLRVTCEVDGSAKPLLAEADRPIDGPARLHVRPERLFLFDQAGQRLRLSP